ncbi:MAG: 3-phosphoshikimate 1-carboxyvinyltransferase, partial [Pseudomonadota bacterium]
MTQSSGAGTNRFVSVPGGKLCGELHVPGDKSITHRALMLGAIAEGTTTIVHPLRGEDCLATEQALCRLGARVRVEEGGKRLVVDGVGATGLAGASAPLDLGNSGTGMRLMCGLLAGRPFESVLVGDESLTRRPMERVAKPLRAMGARVDTSEGGTPPVILRAQAADEPLNALHYDLPVASAQVKSAVLLAGLRAKGTTQVREPACTRDHTERMLQAFGVVVRSKAGLIEVQGLGARILRGQDIVVPCDISSAAFFLVAASLCPGSDLLLRDVGVNPTRTGILDALLL